MSDAPTRRGGRAGRTATSGPIEQKKFRQPRRLFSPTDIISADALEAIHTASLTILEEIGMDFLNAEARAICVRAGATVEQGTIRVRFDRGLILDAIKSCPPEFTLHACNPAHHVRIGGDFGAAHTRARYRDAFYAPILSDWRNFESWREAGSPTAMEKANRVWKDVLAAYEPPPRR